MWCAFGSSIWEPFAFLVIDEYLSIFAGKVVDFYLIYTCGGGIIKIKGLLLLIIWVS